MKILITSGTGTIAGELIKRLSAAGHKLLVMGRSPEKFKNLPKNVEGVVADFDRPESWEGIFEGVQKLCLITPAMLDEGEKGAAFATTALAQGVEHIVFLGIHNVETGKHIPHFSAKIKIKDVLQKSGRPYTAIEPNNFYQNDLWFIPSVKNNGKYLQPVGEIGLNRVDVRDIADAFVNALSDSRHFFRSYPLVGPEPITGEKTASIYSDLLGKEVVYPKDCMAQWEQMMTGMIPEWLLADWKVMFAHFNKCGLRADPIDLIEQEKILGKAPRRYEDFIREML